MANVCFIADTHRQHRELTIPECDILIYCGDMCSFRNNDIETLRDIDVWFSEQPVGEVICVAGNHDFLLENDGYQFQNARLLTDALVETRGLKIYGSPWCPALPFFAFHQSELGLKKKWQQIPTGIDILVTHTPPEGILDLPTSRHSHLGCPHLRHELKRINPRFHAFGHIHASFGSHQEGDTLFLNAAVVRGSEMKVSNPPTCHRITSDAVDSQPD